MRARNREEGCPVHYLRITSYLMTIVGLAMAVYGVVADMSFLAVVGVLMTVAGLMKVLAMAIWNGSVFPAARLERED